jgi:hypothetical protein
VVRAERLVELSALVERLMRVIDPAYIPVWLRKPTPALGDEKPIDLVAAGRYRDVARVIALKIPARADPWRSTSTAVRPDPERLEP